MSGANLNSSKWLDLGAYLEPKNFPIGLLIPLDENQVVSIDASSIEHTGATAIFNVTALTKTSGVHAAYFENTSSGLLSESIIGASSSKIIGNVSDDNSSILVGHSLTCDKNGSSASTIGVLFSGFDYSLVAYEENIVIATLNGGDVILKSAEGSGTNDSGNIILNTQTPNGTGDIGEVEFKIDNAWFARVKTDDQGTFLIYTRSVDNSNCLGIVCANSIALTDPAAKIASWGHSLNTSYVERMYLYGWGGLQVDAGVNGNTVSAITGNYQATGDYNNDSGVLGVYNGADVARTEKNWHYGVVGKIIANVGDTSDPKYASLVAYNPTKSSSPAAFVGLYIQNDFDVAILSESSTFIFNNTDAFILSEVDTNESDGFDITIAASDAVTITSNPGKGGKLIFSYGEGISGGEDGAVIFTNTTLNTADDGFLFLNTVNTTKSVYAISNVITSSPNTAFHFYALEEFTSGNLQNGKLVVFGDNYTGTPNDKDIIWADGSLYIYQSDTVDIVPKIALMVECGQHTVINNGQEVVSVQFDMSATKQWTPGAITTQRDMVINRSTYAFSSDSTITNGYTVWIEGEPVAGLHATITNSYALGVGGKVRIDAAFEASNKNALGVFSDATAAVDNCSLVFASHSSSAPQTGGDIYLFSGSILGNASDSGTTNYYGFRPDIEKQGASSEGYAVYIPAEWDWSFYSLGGTMRNGGGLMVNRTDVNDVDHDTVKTDYLIAYSALSTTRTVTLKDTTKSAGREFCIKDETGTASPAKPIVIAPESGTIEGAASIQIEEPYGARTVYCKSFATNWFVR